jgi:tape measure domain-containing protein
MNKLLPLFKGNSDAAVKAFRMIGDTAGGNAQKLDTLTDAYAKVQMKGKTSMEELNRISDAGVPIFAVLSENLGVTTEKLFEMSSKGQITADDLTAAFEQMTSDGGVFFNGMENSSDTFNMRLLGIKENVSILAGEIGAKFLPALKEVAGNAGDAVAAFSEWISEGDNLDRMLDGLTYVLAGVTSGLVAFLIVAKGSAVVTALATAFKELTSAIAANPIGAIAVVITAVLIPALIALYKNWGTVQTYISQGVARLEWVFNSAGSVLKEAFVVSVNAVKGAFWSLLDLIQKDVLGAISNLLGALEKIPLVGKSFAGASAAVAQFSEGITAAAAAHKEAAAAAIEAARAEQDAAANAYNAKVALIDKEAQDRRAALQKMKDDAVQAAEEVAETIIETETETAQERNAIAASYAAIATEEAAIAAEERNAIVTEGAAIAAEERNAIDAEEAATLVQKLEGMGQTEAQYQQEAIGRFAKYFEDRANAQFAADETEIEDLIKQFELKKEFLNQQLAEIQESQNFSDEEKLQATKAVADQIKKIDEEVAALEDELDAQKLESMKTLYSGMKDLILEGLGETRAGAIASRVIASAEAAVNTALAATKALASAPPPWNIAAAAGVVAAGVAQQIKIHSTPIPSAETGGRFVVPETFTGVDGALMRVNRGEEVNVSPRGGEADGGGRTIIYLDGQPIIDFMNRKLRTGEVYEVSPAWSMATG